MRVSKWKLHIGWQRGSQNRSFCGLVYGDGWLHTAMANHLARDYNAPIVLKDGLDRRDISCKTCHRIYEQRHPQPLHYLELD